MDVWDEHQWEAFFREADRRTEVYLRVREAWVRAHPPPPESAPETEHAAWHEALEQHLARHMGWSTPFPPDEPEPGEEIEDGEAWKVGLAEDFPEDQPFEALPIWQAARAFAAASHRWAERLPERHRDTAVVELCAAGVTAASKIAAGHAMGYEVDRLGGNVAQCKRALDAANRALAALQSLRDEPFVEPAPYQRLYEQGYELRNALGMHVQTLRERFEAER